MNVWLHSDIVDGYEYIIIQTMNPGIDKNGLKQGGRLINFTINRLREITFACPATFRHDGVMTYGEPIKAWRKIFSEDDCLEYCKRIPEEKRE